MGRVALCYRKGGFQSPERWLSNTGTMAQFAPEYSSYQRYILTHFSPNIFQD